MSEQKHTPGPWELNPTSSGGLLVVRAEQSLQVFPVADAHLIAAAPDLLAALVELVAAGQFAVESCDELAVMLRLGAATDAAHTAIAKAEGRS